LVLKGYEGKLPAPSDFSLSIWIALEQSLDSFFSPVLTIIFDEIVKPCYGQASKGKKMFWSFLPKIKVYMKLFCNRSIIKSNLF